MIDVARGFAHAAHYMQRDRDGELHIKHVARVVANVEYQLVDVVTTTNGGNYIAAAWLHDVIEDTDVTFEYLGTIGINATVINAVRLLTRRPGEETYTEYVERVADASGEAGEIARAVKRADLADNLERSTRDGNEGLIGRYGKAMRTIGAA